jgi:single-strand DNA-binding protein
VNDIQVTLRGNVASEPRHVRFDDGNTLTSFRLASNSRYFDRKRNEWVDRGTVFVAVTCRRSLASNAAASVRKGHPLVVTGRLWERLWSSNGRSGRSMEVDATTVGHDLAYGTTEFVRIVRAARIETVKDVQGDRMAYLLARDAEQAGELSPTDISDLTVFDAPPARPSPQAAHAFGYFPGRPVPAGGRRAGCMR